MTKQSAIQQLDTIIGKLSHLNYHIEGNTDLNSAIRLVASVKGKLESGSNKIRKIK